MRVTLQDVSFEVVVPLELLLAEAARALHEAVVLLPVVPPQVVHSSKRRPTLITRKFKV